MRSFEDTQGGHWQAALLEASFGNVMMVFSPLGADGARKTALDAANLHEAEQLLADADETALRQLLAQAVPWG